MHFRAILLKSIKEKSADELAQYKKQQQGIFDEAIEEKKREIAEADKNAGEEDNTAQIPADYEANKDEVISMLIGNIMNVNIDIPRVVKGNFEDEDDK